MPAINSNRLHDGDRVRHQTKGLGTITTDPAEIQTGVARRDYPVAKASQAYVVWDSGDGRVGIEPLRHLELIPRIPGDGSASR